MGDNGGKFMKERLIYMTASGPEEARRIGRTLVEERLVACVNILERVHSIYWWDGKIQEEPEAVLVAKTQGSLVERLIQRVKALHSYDCPCVVGVPITEGNPEFLAWIAEETREEAS